MCVAQAQTAAIFLCRYLFKVLSWTSDKPTCTTCGLVCKSAGGLTRHSKIHKDVPQPKILNNGNFKCYICERTRKTKAGLKSHLRAHDRAVNN